MNPWIFLLIGLGAISLAGCENAQPEGATPSRNASVPDGPDWLTDFRESTAVAAEEKRPILANFTGSDWCAPCIHLKKTVFQTEEFAEYASGNLVLLEVDFPQNVRQPEEIKRQNQELAAAFGVEGFPTLILLSPEGEEVARAVGYLPANVTEFLRWTENARDG